MIFLLKVTFLCTIINNRKLEANIIIWFGVMKILYVYKLDDLPQVYELKYIKCKAWTYKVKGFWSNRKFWYYQIAHLIVQAYTQTYHSLAAAEK